MDNRNGSRDLEVFAARTACVNDAGHRKRRYLTGHCRNAHRWWITTQCAGLANQQPGQQSRTRTHWLMSPPPLKVAWSIVDEPPSVPIRRTRTNSTTCCCAWPLCLAINGRRCAVTVERLVAGPTVH
ncbi:TPA: hypothetical protein QEL58_003840 [Stenotrophomonas maltophilia]|nr:hypothetical protein [Stenotrophomonas maltophilia]